MLEKNGLVKLVEECGELIQIASGFARKIPSV